ncbi:MAG: hypothetical protein L0332_23000 [Chloroflexi bacterium]|nr:hypothetical protein [Chloroflexota bacterium]MCI0578221.1 hypothetical protein [Chloroflexota bacterium]MCI0645286.1 hypothetical protein [Chloroflexota bacterium]MCI0729560.1 hypothetical protein [Chloroflexota bacterium]
MQKTSFTVVLARVLAGAPVVRAALLVSLSLLDQQVGCRQTGLNSLAFVAAGMVLIDPNIL